MSKKRIQYHKRSERLQQLLDYLHTIPKGKTLTQQEIADDLGVQRSNLPGYLKELVEVGAVTRRGKWGAYTYKPNRKYVVRKRAATVSESPESKESNPGEAEVQYIDTTEGLAKEFVMDTGDTNVAGFIKWVKNLFGVK